MSDDKWKLAKAEDMDMDAVEMMEEIIAEHHRDLLRYDKDIVLLFCPEPTADKGRLSIGKPHACSLRERLLSGVDGCITLAWSWWETASPHKAKALLDHELSHFHVDEDTEVLTVHGHDVEEFLGVWERYGAWTEDLQNAVKVVRQLQLPGTGEGSEDIPVTIEHDGESVDTTMERMTQAVAAVGSGQGIDSGEKGIGKAATYAEKYFT